MALSADTLFVGTPKQRLVAYSRVDGAKLAELAEGKFSFLYEHNSVLYAGNPNGLYFWDTETFELLEHRSEERYMQMGYSPELERLIAGSGSDVTVFAPHEFPDEGP